MLLAIRRLQDIFGALNSIEASQSAESALPIFSLLSAAVAHDSGSRRPRTDDSLSHENSAKTGKPRDGHRKCDSIMIMTNGQFMSLKRYLLLKRFQLHKYRLNNACKCALQAAALPTQWHLEFFQLKLARMSSALSR
jgi:hypothetical protein